MRVMGHHWPFTRIIIGRGRNPMHIPFCPSGPIPQIWTRLLSLRLHYTTSTRTEQLPIIRSIRSEKLVFRSNNVSRERRRPPEQPHGNTSLEIGTYKFLMCRMTRMQKFLDTIDLPRYQPESCTHVLTLTLSSKYLNAS